MYSKLFVAALGAVAVSAAPSHFFAKRGSATNTTSSSGVNDTVILQFALNLEFLESTFYATGLTMFNDTDFQNAGYNSSVRDRFLQIQEHEAAHVTLLQEALGPDAPQPCNYTFPITDVKSFVSLSFALESAGESAYLGAAGLISSPEVLTTAATILVVEARQAAFVGGSVLNNSPFNGPFDTPLNTSAVFSLAAGFIQACPANNPPLPVIPLNTLTINPANATVGDTISLSVGLDDFSTANIPILNSSFVPTPPPSLTGAFVAYFHDGQNVTFTPINSDNTTVVPDGLDGIVYASVVSTNETLPNANTTLSGLAVLNIPLPPTANATV